MILWNDLVNSTKNTIKRINWPFILLVIFLAYGFLLTNQSIGIDDENFDFYFKNKGVAASGRWGSLLFMKVIDTYSYLPVWRDLLAIIVLLFTAVVFICTAERVYEKKLNLILVNIIIAMVISYPLISKMFIYIDNSLETAACLLFAALASCFFFMARQCNPIKWGAILAVFIFLVLGCSLIENTLVYFCIEICWIALIKKEKDTLLIDIIFPVVICMLAYMTTKAVGYLITKTNGMYYSNYAVESYYKWNSIHCVGDLKLAAIEVIDNFKYWVKTYFSVKLFWSSVLFWLIYAAICLMKKKMHKTIYAIAIIIASFAMYFITANGGLPLRIFTDYVISVVGCVTFIWVLIEEIDNMQVKQTLQIVFIGCCILCILYQTKETNEYYQLDYKRFLRDQDVARNVNYDLEKLVGITPEVPVVFFGQPEQYGDISLEGEWALQTIYGNNQEGESIRIHRFFDMMGYHYPDILNEEITIYNLTNRNSSQIIKDAKERALVMNCYPYDGYIDVAEDIIIIKLGEIS